LCLHCKEDFTCAKWEEHQRSCKGINAQCPNLGCDQLEGLNTIDKLEKHVYHCEKTLSYCKTCEEKVYNDESVSHSAYCIEKLLKRLKKSQNSLYAENERLRAQLQTVSAKLEKFQMRTESERTRSETAIANSQMPIQIFIAEQGGKFLSFNCKLSDYVWEVKHAIGLPEVSTLFYKNRLL
jgi:hypothetical protein